LQFSYFKGGIKNAKNSTDISFEKAVKILQSEDSRKKIALIRDAKDKSVLKVLKSNLDYFTWSGTFRHRTESKLLKHSGLICIDLDEQRKDKTFNIQDAQFIKEEISNSPYTLLCFLSPSGKGLKVVHRISPEPALHKAAFEWLRKYYAETWNVEVDESGSDVTRACFISYDAELFCNPDAKEIPLQQPAPVSDIAPAKKKSPQAAVDPAPDESNVEGLLQKKTPAPEPVGTAAKKLRVDLERALFCADQIEQRKIDITQAYDDWEIACRCLTLFGEQGREIFHRISRFHPEYDETKTNEKFDHIDKTRRLDKDGKPIFTSPAKFFSICKAYDLEIRHPENVPAKKDKKADAPDEKPKKAKPEISNYEFWDEIFNPEKEKKEWIIDVLKLTEFLNEVGGFWRLPFNEDKDYNFIQIKDNIVYESNPLVMKDFCMKYLSDKPDVRPVKKKLLQQSKNIFSQPILEGIPKNQDLNFIKDDANTCYLYFNNCFVEVTKTSITARDYKDLKGNIWGTQRINRDFKLNKDFTGSDFYGFLVIAATGKAIKDTEPDGDDLKRVTSMQTTFGYMIHQYKTPENAKMICAVDSKVSYDKRPNGRTGKSLFSKGFAQFVKTLTIDAQNFNFNYQHRFELVTMDTRVINFNDAGNKFPLDKLFGITTEDFYVAPKNRPGFTIPYEDSPKMYFSTNHIPVGEGDSFEARRHILEFGEFFNKERTPAHVFGRLFFLQWDEEEWNRFYNFGADCIQSYLSLGLISFPTQNFELRKLMSIVPDEFLDWAGSGKFEPTDYDAKNLFNETDAHVYDKKQKYQDFLEITDDYKLIKMNTFTRWLKLWADFNGFAVNPHKEKENGRWKSGDKEYIVIVRKKKKENS
jgi:hypothetical protein